MATIKVKYTVEGVSSSDTDSVYLEAFHYWQQYHEDGEYYKILGGESPAEKLKAI